MTSNNTPYFHIGGEPAIHLLVDRFYFYMDTITRSTKYSSDTSALYQSQSMSLRDMANALNKFNVKTYRGHDWKAQSVANLIKRLEKI